MDNVNNDYAVDDDLEDIDDYKLSWYEKALNWVASHKTATCISIVGLPIFLIWLGAKLFSKTETVEVEVIPDTIIEHYNMIPKETISTTMYEYVLKDEYKNID